MDMLQPDDAKTVVGGLVTVIMAAAYWLRIKKPQEDKLIAAASADISIIERLERECKRLSEQNEKLANSLNAFQLQILTFQTENQKLAFENNALREENLSLREEIMELRKEVHELSSELMKIRGKECPGCGKMVI